MKKLIITFVVGLFLFGCSSTKEITIDLPSGQVTGTYEGELENDVPNGNGKFTYTREDGELLTYEGGFENGLFEGEGKKYFPEHEDWGMEVGTYHEGKIVPLSEDESLGVFANIDDYMFKEVTISGKVKSILESSGNDVFYEFINSPFSNMKTAVLYVKDRAVELYVDEYFTVTGLVYDKANNAFGEYPAIRVDSASVADISQFLSKVRKTYNLNDTYTQNGYSITVEKIELAEDETRVYVKVDNQGTDKFSLYSFNTYIIQNNKQYNGSENFNYPKIETSLFVGNSTQGIIVYDRIEDKPFQIRMEADSENYSENFEPYLFDIK